MLARPLLSARLLRRTHLLFNGIARFAQTFLRKHSRLLIAWLWSCMHYANQGYSGNFSKGDDREVKALSRRGPFCLPEKARTRFSPFSYCCRR